MVVKNPKNPLWLVLTAITIYVIVACLMTRTAIFIIDHLHEVKDRCHYNWDEKDMGVVYYVDRTLNTYNSIPDIDLITDNLYMHY